MLINLTSLSSVCTIVTFKPVKPLSAQKWKEDFCSQTLFSVRVILFTNEELNSVSQQSRYETRHGYLITSAPTASCTHCVLIISSVNITQLQLDG